MSEIWAIQVRVGNRWETRRMNVNKDSLVQYADLYVGRALEAGYEARIVPFVADESRQETIELVRIAKR